MEQIIGGMAKIGSYMKIIDKINHFVFENEKPGRAFIKIISPNKCQTELIINTLNKCTKNS